jgi:hypothetical protein
LLARVAMRDASRRYFACPTCGSLEISAGYRFDRVVYFACTHCSAAWAAELPAFENALESPSERQKRQHSHFLGDFD